MRFQFILNHEKIKTLEYLFGLFKVGKEKEQWIDRSCDMKTPIWRKEKIFYWKNKVITKWQSTEKIANQNTRDFI